MAGQQLKLFELPPPSQIDQTFKQLRNPIWTEDKSRLIEQYLYLFVMVTKHGNYIDGFAGPQDRRKLDAWAAHRVMKSKPQMLRKFFLFDSNSNQIKLLRKLQRFAGDRLVEVYEADFNTGVHQILNPSKVKSTEATFCLLDQRTFECFWSTVEALARYKAGGLKIELFYFLPTGWFERAISGLKDDSKLKNWWGRKDWRSLKAWGRTQLLEEVVKRFSEELGYRYVSPWPIFKKRSGRAIMYHMIHASDHPEAHALMERAYRQAVRKKEAQAELQLILKVEGENLLS